MCDLHVLPNGCLFIVTTLGFIEETSANKKSATAWQVINEISGRKSTNKSKIKANSQQERLDKWKAQFQKLLVKEPIVIEEPIGK